MSVNSPEKDLRQLPKIPTTRYVSCGDYTAEIHTGDSYMLHLDALLEKATALKAEVFQMSDEKAREIMKKHMRPASIKDEIEIPSIMFFLTQDLQYIGYATHRVFMIDTSEGSIPLDIVTRTITGEHQGKGLGRFSIQQGLAIHHKARWLGYRTQSPPAIYATMQAKVSRPGRHFPFEATYDSEPNLLAHQIMMGLFYRIRRYGARPDMKFGVSVHDYDEENKAYIPRADHEPTMQLARIMQDRFRMRFKRGDSLYGVLELI